MPDTSLIGGPYAAPPCKPGSVLRDRRRGRVTVAGLTKAPVPWPYAYRAKGGGNPSPILCGDLERALRRESSAAIQRHWGVSKEQVSRWRRALRIPQDTAGTIRLKSVAGSQAPHPTRPVARAGSKAAVLFARLRRREPDISITEAARRAEGLCPGLSRKRLGDYIAGRIEPRPQRLAKLAEAWGV